jgi:hypothetical protein
MGSFTGCELLKRLFRKAIMYGFNAAYFLQLLGETWLQFG